MFYARNMAAHDSCFVGREAELQCLEEHWHVAQKGERSVVFVTGEPGAGKSALLSAFTERLREREPNTRVVDGDCNPQTGTNDAFLPFREILAELTGTESITGAGSGNLKPERHRDWLRTTRNILMEHGPDLVDIFVPGGAILTRLSTQAADKLREKGRPGADARKDTNAPPGLEQHHLLEQYTNVIRTVACTHPLVLIVDDLHWADEASITLLFHLARRLAGVPVLILGAYRANEITRTDTGEEHPLNPVINELRRYAGDITIDLLTAQEERGRAFVNELIDAEPNRLGEDFREELFRHTGGHALFTTETLRHLKDLQLVQPDAEGRWCESENLSWSVMPARVDGVIRERLRRLAPEQRSLLEAAAVLGEQFHVEPLALMLDKEPRDVRKTLSEELGRTHQLVHADKLERIDGLRLARYAFRHNLIHRYLYDNLDEIERPTSHEQAAEALESLTKGKAEVLALHLARHFDLAEIPERAANWYVVAGQRARRSLALEESRRHYERALACCEATGDDDAGRLALEAQISLGALDLLGGSFEAANERFDRLLSLPEAQSPGWQARLLQEKGTALERLHKTDLALDALSDALECLESAEDTPSTNERWLSIQVSRLWVNYWKGDAVAMRSVISETQGPMAEGGRIDQKRRFHSGIAALGYREDRYLPSDATLDAAEHAAQLARSSGSVYDIADSQFGLGFTYLLRGDIEAAQPILDAALEGAQRCGDRTLEARCLTYRVVLSRMRHDSNQLEERRGAARELTETLGMREYIAVLEACDAWLALQAADDDLARVCTERALEIWTSSAPRYPLKWMARLPLLALQINERRWESALDITRKLTSNAEAKLGNGVEDSLIAALQASVDADRMVAEQALNRALEQAREAGYL